MKILIITDVVVYNFDGKLYLSTAFGSVLKRYYDSFGKVSLCSRVTNQEPPSKYTRVDEYIGSILAIHGLMTPFSTLMKKSLNRAINDCDLVVGRLGSILACRLYGMVKKNKKPFYSEIMSDPWDTYWNHSLKGKLIAPYMYLKTKSMIKHSDYALYVTSRFLQERYPCKNETVGISNVKITSIDESALEKRMVKIREMDCHNLTLITTAAVNVRYKGHEYVIKAIPKLNKLGIKINYVMVGGGDQSYLKKLSERLGVSDQIEFTGLLSLDEVFAKIDDADLYLQPSLQEGLPRSVIEAMSRACPCIGAKTAGIPELIEEKFVVKRKSVSDIVDKIVMFCDSSYEERAAVAVRNFDESKKYREDILDSERKSYYEKIKSDFK